METKEITATIEFDSHIQDNDRIELSGKNYEEIRQKFIDWCESRHLNWQATNPRTIKLED